MAGPRGAVAGVVLVAFLTIACGRMDVTGRVTGTNVGADSGDTVDLALRRARASRRCTG